MTSKEFEFVILNHPTKKRPGPVGLAGKLSQIFKEKNNANPS